MATTPACLAAVFTAVPRSVRLALLAWTSTILHPGQVADTASRSRACSPAQPTSKRGSEVPPVWLMMRRQPLASTILSAWHAATVGELGVAHTRWAWARGEGAAEAAVTAVVTSPRDAEA